MVEFFCSKDCPDCCSFFVDEKGNFEYIDKANLGVNFLCKKLKSFYLRETDTSDRSFFIHEGKRIYTDFNEITEYVGDFLKKNENAKKLVLIGSGSLGYNMSYYSLLFSKLKNSYFVDGSICDETGISAHLEDFGACVNPPHENLKDAEVILLFGKNCKVVSPHLYAYLKKLKSMGKRIVYIDPIFTETAEKLSDKFISINPATDNILSAKILYEMGKSSYKIDEETFKLTNVSKEDLNFLVHIFSEKKVGIVVGFGLQRYGNGKNIVNWINRLAVLTGNEERLYFGRSSKENFRKLKINKTFKIKVYELTEYLKKGFFDIVIVIAANPLVTYPNSNVWRKALSNKSVIVIDTNITETSKYANFFIKVGGMFAQEDAMGSYFFNVDHRRLNRVVTLPNDTDVVKKLSKKLGVEIEIGDVGKIKIIKDRLTRRYNNREIELILPKNETGRFRLLTLSNYHYLNSQLAGNYDKEYFVFMNEIDVEMLGLKDGEEVYLKNELGKVKMRVRKTDRCVKGIIYAYKNRVYKGETLNTLTKSLPTDSDNGVALYDTFVEVEKV